MLIVGGISVLMSIIICAWSEFTFPARSLNLNRGTVIIASTRLSSVGVSRAVYVVPDPINSLRVPPVTKISSVP